MFLRTEVSLRRKMFKINNKQKEFRIDTSLVLYTSKQHYKPYNKLPSFTNADFLGSLMVVHQPPKSLENLVEVYNLSPDGPRQTVG